MNLKKITDNFNKLAYQNLGFAIINVNYNYLNDDNGRRYKCLDFTFLFKDNSGWTIDDSYIFPQGIKAKSGWFSNVTLDVETNIVYKNRITIPTPILISDEKRANKIYVYLIRLIYFIRKQEIRESTKKEKILKIF